MHRDERLFRPDPENPTEEDVRPVYRTLNALPIAYLDPDDISNAVLSSPLTAVGWHRVRDQASTVDRVAMPWRMSSVVVPAYPSRSAGFCSGRR